MPNSQTFKKRLGSRAEVFHGVAKQTTGGLMKRDLMKNKHGEIVSKKKHMTAKKEKRLEKHGFFAQKGKFGYVKKDSKKSKSKSASRKSRKTRKSNK